MKGVRAVSRNFSALFTVENCGFWLHRQKTKNSKIVQQSFSSLLNLGPEVNEIDLPPNKTKEERKNLAKKHVRIWINQIRIQSFTVFPVNITTQTSVHPVLLSYQLN